MDPAALADFNAVAAHGGFGSASRATGRPKASLSRHVRDLEAELGVRLIERGGRALRLTEEGGVLHRRSAPLLDELGLIGEELANASGSPRGRLRVSVPAMLGTTPGFGRAAARFIADYPDVRLEIVAEDRFVDPVAEGFDIVVRANPAADSTLVGQLLRREHLVVAAAPTFARPSFSDSGVPASVQAVTLTLAPPDEIWRVRLPEGEAELRPVPVLRVSSLVTQREAVEAGAGAGVFPRGRLAEALAAGRLVEWGAVPGRRVEVWALHPSRHLTSIKVRLFIAVLSDFLGTR